MVTEGSTAQETAAPGVVVVTHGAMGVALVEAAEMILGPQERCASVSVGMANGVDQTVEAIKEAVGRVDAGGGALLLTDLFGGSPTTMSMSLYKAGNIEVVAGVSLPMLIKALQGDGKPLEALAAEVKQAGQQGIVVAGEVLGRRRGKGK